MTKTSGQLYVYFHENERSFKLMWNDLPFRSGSRLTKREQDSCTAPEQNMSVNACQFRDQIENVSLIKRDKYETK